jgi:hypothetical protein
MGVMLSRVKLTQYHVSRSTPLRQMYNFSWKITVLVRLTHAKLGRNEVLSVRTCDIANDEKEHRKESWEFMRHCYLARCLGLKERKMLRSHLDANEVMATVSQTKGRMVSAGHTKKPD